MMPRYAVTKGLSNNAITKAVRQALDAGQFPADYLPDSIRMSDGLCTLEYAIGQMHFPKDKESLVRARERLVFDEFLLFILMIRRMRESNQEIKISVRW